MLKKTITYEDYNGVQRTEDFYFNLTKVECMELEYDTIEGGSLSESINTLIEAKDMATVIKTIKQIVLTAYGVKSPDGKRFIKSAELRDAFEQSPAFEEVYWELVSDAEKAADFVSGIVPSTVRNALGPDPKSELIARANDVTASIK